MADTALTIQHAHSAIADIALHDRDATDMTPSGMLQRRWEIDQLATIVRQQQPHRILEIGTYHGGTLRVWQDCVPHAHIVSIDTCAAADPRSHFPDVTFLVGDSRDPGIIAAATRHGLYDFVFIDGGHVEHEVQHDWSVYHQLCRSGGLIALHDILPGRGAQQWIEVSQVWQRIQHHGYVTQELIASLDVDWGGIGLVWMS